jgi:glucose/arabinose dehydrogenase
MNRFLGSLLVLSLGAPLHAQSLRAIRIAENIGRPTDLTSPPGDTSRVFLVEGRVGIRIIKDGLLLPTPFLDISNELANNQAIGSLAFHPDYANNGRFFLLYVDSSLVSHVAEYHVSADPDIADPASRIEILGPWQQNTLVHLWNCLQFGPDGKLYVGIGDDIWTYDYVPNYSQDLTTLLGKILRIDVDIPPPYIPPDNPFVGQPGVREEIWMWGLRQPWRFSFDSLTGDV